MGEVNFFAKSNGNGGNTFSLPFGYWSDSLRLDVGLPSVTQRVESVRFMFSTGSELYKKNVVYSSDGSDQAVGVTLYSNRGFIGRGSDASLDSAALIFDTAANTLYEVVLVMSDDVASSGAVLVYLNGYFLGLLPNCVPCSGSSFLSVQGGVSLFLLSAWGQRLSAEQIKVMYTLCRSRDESLMDSIDSLLYEFLPVNVEADAWYDSSGNGRDLSLTVDSALRPTRDFLGYTVPWEVGPDIDLDLYVTSFFGSQVVFVMVSGLADSKDGYRGGSRLVTFRSLDVSYRKADGSKGVLDLALSDSTKITLENAMPTYAPPTGVVLRRLSDIPPSGVSNASPLQFVELDISGLSQRFTLAQPDAGGSIPSDAEWQDVESPVISSYRWVFVPTGGSTITVPERDSSSGGSKAVGELRYYYTVNEVECEVPASIELMQLPNEKLEVLYGAITITEFSYAVVDGAGGSAYPTLRFTQERKQAMSSGDPQPMSPLSVSYENGVWSGLTPSASFTATQLSGFLGVGSSNGKVTWDRTTLNSSRYVDVTVEVSNGGNVASASARSEQASLGSTFPVYYQLDLSALPDYEGAVTAEVFGNLTLDFKGSGLVVPTSFGNVTVDLDATHEPGPEVYINTFTPSAPTYGVTSVAVTSGQAGIVYKDANGSSVDIQQPDNMQLAINIYGAGDSDENRSITIPNPRGGSLDESFDITYIEFQDILRVVIVLWFD